MCLTNQIYQKQQKQKPRKPMKTLFKKTNRKPRRLKRSPMHWRLAALSAPTKSFSQRSQWFSQCSARTFSRDKAPFLKTNIPHSGLCQVVLCFFLRCTDLSGIFYEVSRVYRAVLRFSKRSSFPCPVLSFLACCLRLTSSCNSQNKPQGL